MAEARHKSLNHDKNKMHSSVRKMKCYPWLTWPPVFGVKVQEYQGYVQLQQDVVGWPQQRLQSLHSLLQYLGIVSGEFQHLPGSSLYCHHLHNDIIL